MELILRFFAFFYHSNQYQRPVKNFLNRYMATNRNLEKQPEAELRAVFTDACKVISDNIGVRAFRPRRVVNAAVVDSLMFGIARRLASGPIKNLKDLVKRFEKLMASKEYTEATETSTSQETSVRDRLMLAEKAFSGLQ